MNYTYQYSDRDRDSGELTVVTILALAAAILYGTADFLGGVASRRASVFAVLALTGFWAGKRVPYPTHQQSRGRPVNTRKSAALLAAFEAWKAETGKHRTGDFAKFVHDRMGVQAGASPEAIKRHINRAIKAGHY